MSVLISGGAGFVGLVLVDALLARGERVVVFDLAAPPSAAMRSLKRHPGTLIVETGDVRDTAVFADCLRRHAVDRLFPFSAITSAAERESVEPERIVEVNLVGFISQLRAARDGGVRRVVAPSSIAVYGESFYGMAALDEATTPCVPTGLYGVTKYAVERTALRLGALWDLDVIAARISAVFGPWERDTGLRDMLGPHWDLARAAVRGEAVVLPLTLPPFSYIYARDVASALLHLLDMPSPKYRVFNIGCGIAWGPELRDFAARLAAAYPAFAWRQSGIEAEQTLRLSDTRARAPLDNSRLVATGWTPRFLPDAAYTDYLRWLALNGDAL